MVSLPNRVRIVRPAGSVEHDDKWMMVNMLAAITQAWSPSSTYQQLLTVGWVHQQLLQNAVFDTFNFEGAFWGGTKNLLRGRTCFFYISSLRLGV